MGGWLDEHRACTAARHAETAKLMAENRRLVAQFRRTQRRVQAACAQLHHLCLASPWVQEASPGIPGGPRARLAAARPAGPAAVATPDPLAAILDAAGLGQDDLDDLTDALIAAHRKAEALDDAEMRAAAGDVLWLIGRRMAAKLGPRTAGVPLN